MSSAVILGQPREDMPLPMQLAQEVAKREQAQIYSHFAMTLLNEAVDEIQALTKEETPVIRQRIMDTAEAHAKEKMLAQQEQSS